jgi:hypothetical protein
MFHVRDYNTVKTEVKWPNIIVVADLSLFMVK